MYHELGVENFGESRWIKRSCLFHKIILPGKRSSPLQVFLQKGFLKICCKLTGEHSCRSAILLLCNFIEIKLGHGCSPVNCSIFSEHLFLGTILEGCFSGNTYHIHGVNHPINNLRETLNHLKIILL